MVRVDSKQGGPTSGRAYSLSASMENSVETDIDVLCFSTVNNIKGLGVLAVP